MNASNQQAPPSPQPPASISPISKKNPPFNKTGWLKWILLIIIAVLLSSGGTYFVLTREITKTPPISTQLLPSPNQTLDPTVNWETYAYTSFSLKLPQDWKENSRGNPIQLTNYEMPAVGQDFDPVLDKGRLKVEIYTNNKTQDLRTYVDQEKRNAKELRGEELSWIESSVLVDKQPAIKVKTLTPGFVIYAKHPSKPIMLSMAFILDFDNYSDLANQILSTFKFTQ